MSNEKNNGFFPGEENEPENESFRDDEIYTYFGSRRGASHRRHSRRKRRKRIVIATVVLSIPLVLISAVLIVFFHFYNLMDIRSVAETSVSYSDIEVTFTDAELAEIPEGEVILPDGTTYSEKGVTNILLIGTDERTDYFNYKSRPIP